MSVNNKEKEPKKEFSVSRRGFLKTGVAAAAMGVMGAIAAPSKIANAASPSLSYQPTKGQWSKLRPEANYGGASVRYVESNDQWLGTTKILGKVIQTDEKDAGFSLALAGDLGDKAKAGFLSTVFRHPTVLPFADAIGAISAPSMLTGEPNPNKLQIPDPEQMSQHIKDFAYYLRADEVGIGIMPDYAYYASNMAPPLGAYLVHAVPMDTPYGKAPITDKLPYVICMSVEMHLETWLASTGYDGISNAQSERCYHASANAAVIMASYIRQLGYHARAHHFGNYELIIPPVLIACGMGELTRTGDTAAHPRIGFRHKSAAVTTDLPLIPDKPIDFGMLDFCRVCKKCADNCPAQAITFDDDPVPHNGYLRWNTDSKKCTVFRCANDEGVNCGRCIKVCPWNSKEDSWFHRAGLYIGSKGENASRMLKSIDDMFGYGTEEVTKYKWWLEWPDLYKYDVNATLKAFSATASAAAPGV
ncbi:MULTISPECIES: reductive dehalogenase [Dehalobacter]|uniref:Reductive dehalogenase n=3 Tax=Bacteria TaxID=2 RepID=A0A857DHV6_9FIRM|nr:MULTISPECIES: reductive dehalogenase [Dehalobacter]MCG1025851.1 reductive dehalogenase [Dehalobacter sp.]OCZ50953.1 reductive dehalogenase [Dehalobacter sp. TeCB1]QGZ99904.1 reductive dehalogenase [Dehalobacter restrictus]